ncbi:MAG: PSD1 and planctomycete cytochrome C domain-containing protein [Planctomycetes bacterium]|nr:PSD1 and planctomycete cytochrome C domain-containing protein [Planctomycetota bacterium]
MLSSFLPLLLVLPQEPTPADTSEGLKLFEERVRPILQNNCVECHNTSQSKGEFDLSTRESLLFEGEFGAWVIPGEPDESELLYLIDHADKPFMPKDAPQLSQEDRDAIRRWIELDAPYSGPIAEQSGLQVTEEDRQHWAFRTLAADTGKSIDEHLKHALTERALKMGPEAEPRQLLRRLTLDLTGLPPTPLAMKRFLTAWEVDAEAAYDAAIERLLSDSAYGERWGRHWLDAARYADSGGYEFDVERPDAWPYRDWVIEAYNQDLPYDLFLRLQLAGDELMPGDPSAHAATGFLTAGPRITNQQTIQNRYDELDDIVATMGSSMLGVTLGCARCHDHKFDPIPTKDYYAILGAFKNTRRVKQPMLPADELSEYRDAKAKYDEEIRATQHPLEEWKKRTRAAIVERRLNKLDLTEEQIRSLLAEKDPALSEKYGDVLKIEDRQLEEEANETELAEKSRYEGAINALKQREPRAPQRVLSIQDKGPDPEKNWLLARGNPLDPKGELELAFLQVIGPASPEEAGFPIQRKVNGRSSGQRSSLAAWMTDVGQGAGRLVARVEANRIWHHHFGVGLVTTPGDFGTMADPPSHPKLLDDLAQRLIAGGWSRKALHREILKSKTYRQAGQWTPELEQIDGDNRLWSYRPPVRLEAEAIRDSILAASGSLNRKMGGPGIRPWIHPDAIATGSTDKWPKGVVDGPATWRRTVYIFQRRSVLVPTLETFDLPDAAQSCTRRNRTTTPTQALAMLNNPFVREQSKLFATRLEREAGEDRAAQVRLGFELTIGRPPTEQELAACLSFLTDETLADLGQVLFNLNEFLYLP